jgi:hypothetical protein
MNGMKAGYRDGKGICKSSLQKKWKLKFIKVVLGLFLFCLLASTSLALDWPSLKFSLVTNGFSYPLGVADPGDASGRLFVVEETGTIRAVQNGAASATPFLDISDRVLFGGAGSEQGLLGLVFPPDYRSKGYFYVNYIRDPDGATIISRFYLTTGKTNLANANSEQILLTLPQPYGNHNGGQLAFGPDGYLYIGLGDGGGSGDPDNRSQDPGQLYGKMLRIDVESVVTNSYKIPFDNPFVENSNYRPEIWALGLRNPWRFSFDSLTGDLYIADVGEGDWEEVDFQPASSSGGENYGWRIMQGSHLFNYPDGFDTNTLTFPVAEYSHDVGQCVIGGYEGRDAGSPRMNGVYFYADYVQGKIWGMQNDGTNWQTTQLAATTNSITSFGQDAAGRVYFVDYQSGSLYAMMDDLLLIKSITLGAGGNILLKWDSSANRTYLMQISNDLKSWSNLGGTITGTGNELSLTDSNAITAASRRFYRVSAAAP